MKAYKFRLRPNSEQEDLMRRFAGCCRFVWNKALALEETNHASGGKYLSFYTMSGMLTKWKKEFETSFLTESHSQILHQALRDLDKSYKKFFAGQAGHPKFKKKGMHDSFRYPQGFKIDEVAHRIYLPKIGWVRYYKSRAIDGFPKYITVSSYSGRWFVSIQTKQIVPDPVPVSNDIVGIDVGVVRFATLSDGTYIKPINSFHKYESKLAVLQKKLAKREKFSANWNKLRLRICRLHQKIANIRNDFLNKITTAISKNHAIVVVEDLKVKRMSSTSSGTIDNHGKRVRSKASLNKSILDQGWYEFRRQLSYKLQWHGGKLIVVPPQYTSQMCSRCGYVDKNNRMTQEKFKCISCGFECNADYNAALNILAAGHAVAACGAERA